VTYGIWNSAVHENHWFVAMIVAFMLAGESRTAPTYWIAILTAAMFNVNLFVFYGITGPEVIARDVGIDLSVILSLLFVAIWFLLVRHAWSLGLTRQPAEQ
jgi:ABC-type dipeptide/oligopeptide/nickel transport system permease component